MRLDWRTGAGAGEWDWGALAGNDWYHILTAPALFTAAACNALTHPPLRVCKYQPLPAITFLFFWFLSSLRLSGDMDTNQRELTPYRYETAKSEGGR